MLKKSLRLNRKDLEGFFKKRARFVSGSIVSARFTENNLKYSRFAFVVSFENKQKRKGRAVLRNLLRRRMSEIAGSLIKSIKPGQDIVFFIKLKNQKAPAYADLKKDILYVLSKSHISRSIL
ncbi:MAG: hypothetical protein UW30_C0004G0023 [Candidatus Giovannonibacteria bacterium GW2011_GWA2_44_13b]|uniref:Uncharacterized protein n=2 Tax=Candidatus Giovannoniibacteriota TaxID=1752738 RepID=A0A0G1K1Y5_9BACT|nr:MAG: hypothetical protein UW30_C0004G0023 [Candidatus Giovannonibacteria bacterium GW2011_GWA2_44_13b]OGF81671.1 MAG: hypothetical protein A2924_03605 [Candidatus Giovannonibacteria bacterium RIFCSPLOWO2_01_FULL_44_16]